VLTSSYFPYEIYSYYFRRRYAIQIEVSTSPVLGQFGVVVKASVWASGMDLEVEGSKSGLGLLTKMPLLKTSYSRLSIELSPSRPPPLVQAIGITHHNNLSCPLGKGM
jgi:hypothetical protein